MSDHHCIRFVLKCPKPVMCKVKRTFWNFKEMDVEGFKGALVVRVNNPLPMTGDVNSLLAAYTTAVARNLDKDTLHNYRPVSNLSHIAKLIEKVVAIYSTHRPPKR